MAALVLDHGARYTRRMASVPTPAQAAPTAFAAPAPAPLSETVTVSETPAVSVPPATPPAPDADSSTWTPWTVGYSLLTLVSTGVSAWHGYKRNGDSASWGVIWGALGAMFPVVTPAVALVQGLNKPSNDVRIHHLEDAFANRPDLVRQLNAEMLKTTPVVPLDAARRLNQQDIESYEHKQVYPGDWAINTLTAYR